MKFKISAKVIVMILCAFILAGSVALYSGIFTDVAERCDRYCSSKYDGPDKMDLFFACYNGCLFGSEL